MRGIGGVLLKGACPAGFAWLLGYLVTWLLGYLVGIAYNVGGFRTGFHLPETKGRGWAAVNSLFFTLSYDWSYNSIYRSLTGRL